MAFFSRFDHMGVVMAGIMRGVWRHANGGSAGGFRVMRRRSGGSE